MKPEWILETVSKERCTIVWLLVPWAQDILDAIERESVHLEDYRLSQWRLMHIGAQPVPPSLIHRWLRYFPHHQYDTNFGLSESIGPGCIHLALKTQQGRRDWDSRFGWEAKVVDVTARKYRGQVGELASGARHHEMLLKDPKPPARPAERLAFHRGYGAFG